VAGQEEVETPFHGLVPAARSGRGGRAVGSVARLGTEKSTLADEATFFYAFTPLGG
jgi:hypothetical protein